jgi:hypothetical protein
MKTYIIQLESHDDVISARDKMAWSKAPRILLVWPRKGRVLDRQADLFLLQRHAQTLGAQIGVVSADLDVRSSAAELGIPVFYSAVQAQRGSWRRPRGKRRLNWRSFRERRASVRVSVKDSEKASVDLREMHEYLHEQPLESTPKRILAFSVGMLAVLVMVMFFVPSAQVTLSPVREEQRLTLPAWASLDIREANPSGGLPAYALSVVVEGSEQAASSGKVNIPDRQAAGEVIFNNLSEVEKEIPAGTVVLAPGDTLLRFATIDDVTLPAGVGEQAYTLVQALVPGLQGNVAAEAIQAVEGPLGLEILVTNPEPLIGGSDRISPSPSAEDYQELAKKLQSSLRDSALADLKAQLQPGQRLVDATLKVTEGISETREPAPGQPADFARLSYQVEYTAYYVLEEDLETVARTALDANRPEGFQPIPGTLEIQLFDPQAEMDDSGAAQWEMDVSWQLESAWSDDLAARAVAGRSPTEAGRVLSDLVPLSSPPAVRLFPSWWVRMPFLSFRIAVVRK